MYYSWPFWPLSEGARFVIFGLFGRFPKAYIYYFRPFLPFSEGGIFVISGHFGHFRRAVYSLFSAILAIFGRW